MMSAVRVSLRVESKGEALFTSPQRLCVKHSSASSKVVNSELVPTKNSVLTELVAFRQPSL